MRRNNQDVNWSKILKPIIKQQAKQTALTYILYLVLTIAVIVGILFLGTWLWGAVAVGALGLPALSFWQFTGLVVLIKILTWRTSKD